MLVVDPASDLEPDWRGVGGYPASDKHTGYFMLKHRPVGVPVKVPPPGEEYTEAQVVRFGKKFNTPTMRYVLESESEGLVD